MPLDPKIILLEYVKGSVASSDTVLVSAVITAITIVIEAYGREKENTTTFYKRQI